MPVVRGRSGTGLLTSVQAKSASAPKQKAKQGSTPSDFTDPIATLPVRSAPASGRPKPVPAPRGTPAQGGKLLAALAAQNPAPGTTAGYRKAAAFVAPVQKQKAFEQRRQAAQRSLALQVNAGKLTPGQAHAKLQQAGFIPGGAAYKEPTGVGGGIAKTVAGTIGIGEAIGKKVVQGFTPQDAPGGTPVTAAEARENPHALYRVDEHGHYYRLGPGDVNAGVISPGTGLIAQTAAGLAQSATYNPAGVTAAITHPVRTAEHVARNLEHTVAHPLARPDQSALLAWALLSGGGAAASRLAGASSALRAGEGVGAALKRPGHAGGSLLHTPEPGVHTIYVPGAKPEGGIGPVPATQVDRLLSRNVLVRKGIQEPRNRRIQRALDKGAPEMAPKTAAGRFIRENFSPQATVGREIRAARRVSVAKAQGPVTAQQRAVHGVFTLGNVSRGENTALQVTAIEGHNALMNPDEVIARHIATHERFIAEGKDVEANRSQIADLRLAQRALKNPSAKFKAALQQTRALSADTEAKLIAAGHLTAETAAGRKANIASIYQGGKYEAPTRGKLGVPSQSLLKARTRVARLEALHTRATAKAAEKAVPYENVHTRTGYRAPKLSTAPELALRRQHVEVEPGKKTPGVPSDMPAKGLNTPTVERLGGALSVARDELARLEKAAAGRVKPTGFVGGPTQAPEGSFFYPLSRRYTENVSRVGSGAYSPNVSEAGGIAPPRTTGIVGKSPFTGKSIENAQRPISVADAIADRATRTNKLLDQEKTYADMWRVATPTRISEHQIPIRSTTQVKAETRKFFSQLHDHLQAHPDERALLDLREAETLQNMLDASAHKTAAVGAKVKGVRWVDRRYLKDLGENSVRGPIEKALDTITNPVRASSLYLRPAYALNLLGNATMQGITQGHLAGSALKSALRAVATDGPENTAMIDSLVGASNSRAFSVKTGVMGKANQQLAEAWNALTDLHARRSSFYHEAAKAGYDTPAKRAALLNDPANARKLAEVTRRANKNMVDFGSMTPLERNTIRRVIYYYPWMSRATIWSLRMLVEHPGKAFTLAQLAQVGADNAHRQIGKMPAWAEQLGLIPVGKAQGGTVPVINPSSINTPGTAAQLGEAAIGTVRAALGLKQGPTGFGSVITPSVGALSGLANTGATGTGTGGATGIQAILQAHPLYGIARRAGLVGKPSKTYPESGAAAALGPWAAGGMFPRQISQSALAAAQAKEANVNLSPGERIQQSGAKTAAALLDQAKQHWPEILNRGQLPPEWTDALRLRTQRYANYDRAGITSKDPDYQRKAYIADVQLLAKLGKLNPAQVTDGVRWAKTAQPDRLRIQRLRLGHTLFRGSVLSYAHKQLKSRGATNLP